MSKYLERCAVTLCKNLHLKSVGSKKNRWLTTQCLNQYALILFMRMLDFVAGCCPSTWLTGARNNNKYIMWHSRRICSEIFVHPQQLCVLCIELYAWQLWFLPECYCPLCQKIVQGFRICFVGNPQNTILDFCRHLHGENRNSKLIIDNNQINTNYCRISNFEPFT